MASIAKFKLHPRNEKSRHPLIVKQIETFGQLEEQLKTYISSKKELKAIQHAYFYAEQKHASQKRKNGDPYIYHPLSTAYFLAQLQMGPQTIMAGLLHDILEDTPVTAVELEKAFGTEVATLVEAVTKVSYFAKENRQEQKSEYLRKIYLSMAKDIRVIIIKLSDRLHNMMTIGHLPLPKQKIIAKETLEIYSSIAHRIGMKEIKNHLEDLSMAVLYPEDFNRIQQLLEKDAKHRQAVIEHLMNEMLIFLRQEKHLKIIDIFGRSKGIYSIYRKMNQFGRSFDELKDILAVRIIARSNDDCYKILGFLHQKYTPLAGKFKDYIATPKNGVYQSLHTTLSDTNGDIFEVQIRTTAMDKVAETGMAAHWIYKEGEVVDIKRRQFEIDEQIDLFRRIIDLDQQRANEKSSGENNNIDHETIENVLKDDYFTTMIYVLTPDKKVITLPYGSTVLDFAYRIHTEIGQKTIGAKIDGVMVPINTVLKSGQIVEIKTAPKQEPTYEQLKIVKTSNAKNRIRKYLAAKLKDDEVKDKKVDTRQLIEKAKNNINSYLNQHYLRWRRKADEQILIDSKKLGFNSLDELYLAVANGEYTLAEIVELVFVDFNAINGENTFTLNNQKDVEIDSKNEIIVGGVPNLKASLASCCRPVPGEPIVGYVTKGSGIKIHICECINVNGDGQEQRLVGAVWNRKATSAKSYTTNIKYYATDRPNLLYDVSKVLTGLKASIMTATVKVDEKTLLATGILKIKIKDADQLQLIISSLKSVPSIVEVKRLVEAGK